MRQLFIPACLCLVTWSSSTATTDARLSLDEFTGKRVVDRTHADSEAQVEQSGIPLSVTAGVMPVPTEDQSERATALARIKHTDALALSPHRAGWVNFEPPELVDPPPPPPAAAKPVIRRTRAEVCDTLARAANDNGLPAPFFIRLLFQESRFNAGAVSPAGALGIAQFMPATAADVGLDNPFDPVQAITASARFLRTLVSQFGNLGLAAAAYNAGPGRVQNWLSKKGKLPEETQGYVKVITGQPAENWRQLNSGVPDLQLPARAPCRETAHRYAWIGPPQIPLPQVSPRREAARLAALEEDKREAERKMAALVAMKTAIRKIESNKERKGSVQLAARRHEKSKRADKKK
jgi:hypothetical protein